MDYHVWINCLVVISIIEISYDGYLGKDDSQQHATLNDLHTSTITGIYIDAINERNIIEE